MSQQSGEWGQFSVHMCGLTLGMLFEKITTCVPYKGHLFNKINSDDSFHFSRMINLKRFTYSFIHSLNIVSHQHVLNT